MTRKRKIDAREASLLALQRVEADDAYVNLALDEVLSSHSLDPRDKRLAAEITYGVITYKLTLDWLIEKVSGRPIKKLDKPIHQILRIGFYQLFYLDRVPPAAAVHATVELVKKGKKRGLAPFVNGVMRGALRKKDHLPWPDKKKDSANYLSVRYSHPLWLVRRWLNRYGPEEAEKLVAANNQAAPLSIRVNTLRTDRDTLLSELTAAGVEAVPSTVVPEGALLTRSGRLTELAPYREGRFQVQGESAMLTSRVLDPQAGDAVLDGCSAPGGKTTHLAQLMNNSGDILALDIHPHRLELVKANCRRMGVDIVRTQCLDAREIAKENPDSFDCILLDVPCSGFGVIRRKPDLKWRRSEDDIRKLAHVQCDMLKAAAAVLKPGGTLVYSTCTNEPEETDEVVEELLKNQDDMVPDDLRPYLPQDWQQDAGKTGIHLLPHIHGVDGFFISRLKKI
ncbi:16S rRNA (cytosine(967)-C(5))-methyltransferase RsmB [Dethiobacter alkaliphilus]|uniref:16S rRNA (cytosine(967)-C(5))-methyltransferase n=1 Tax=Dethiobacter alkaliphilus AHT 1 TaxID=555088 RepID=C0GIQ4_DETAL|nr:16S rRNA (cytosine(967)-C(5))-methyltransferase RsmB [Dethiobacter alkaliphilus]EEG76718.1 sun protein [Dethiobacter alkaliphilus AHT 1]